MRAKDLGKLEQFVTAASTWRNAGKTAGVDLNVLTATFPNGENVTLRWTEEIEESTDPDTGASILTVVDAGWDIQTKTPLQF